MPEWRDDLTISNQERLWRRVPANDPDHVKKAPITGEPRLSSAAFKSRTVLISVAIASLTTPEDLLVGYPEHSIVEVTARVVREAGCIIVRDPKPGDTAHAHIIGTKREDGHLTPSEVGNIANQATWVIYKEP
ncbi:MAG: hypothetical protein HW407_2340 [Bacteroidetes bacterium]|nr:hypothetical protein [Bacteroidota bacterium]